MAKPTPSFPPFPPTAAPSFANIAALLPINAIQWRWNSTTNALEPVQSGQDAPIDSGFNALRQEIINLGNFLQLMLIEMQALNFQIGILNTNTSSIGNVGDLDQIRAAFSADSTR